MGSSNYITNFAGDVSQHMEYFAFGETFIEEHKNSHNSPYKYNGKELDEESGLYYYGARYYDPRISIWLSVDPLANYNPFMDDEHYIDGDHNGGVFNHYNHNVFGYCYQNPIILVDPNGKQTSFAEYSKRFISNQAAAALGASHSVANVLSFGASDTFGLTKIPSGFSTSDKISYWIGRAMADIAMIALGDSTTATGGTMVMVSCATGPGALVGASAGALVALGGAYIIVGGTKDLAYSILMLAELGANINAAADDENAEPVQETTTSTGTSTTTTPLKGGGKNGQHKNQAAKQSAQEKYEQYKTEYNSLKSKPNKTKEDVKARDQAEKQMKHWQKKAQETGENHSQKAKGSN